MSLDRPWPQSWRVLLLLLCLLSLHAETRMTSLRVAPDGRTGFTRLAMTQTGVTFSNLLSNAQIEKNRILENGSGVALGDIDGDGRCDIYFCRLEGSNTLYRNLGDWRFEDITEKAGVGCPQQYSTGAVLADVDGDRDLDLLVNSIGGGTRLFVNDGKGQFAAQEQSGLVAKGGSHSLALGDVDGDGDLDLYVANYRATTFKDIEDSTQVRLRQVGGQLTVPPEYAEQFVAARTGDGYALLEIGEPDLLYLNDGRGHFEPVSWTGGVFSDEAGKPLTAPPRDWGLTVAMRDLNGDLAPDLFVCNDFFSPDRIWLNDGHGRFRPLPRLALRKTSWATMTVDFADLNRDGWDDLLTVDMLSRSHVSRQVQRSNFELAPVPWWGWPPDRFGPESRPQTLRNTLQVGRGDGTYAELAEYAGLAASEWTWGIAFLDVDLDGFEDLLVANGHPHDMTDSDALVRFEEMMRRFKRAEMPSALPLFPALQSAKLAFRNRGDLTFEEVGAAWGFDWVGISQGMALGDLDGDGDLDVVLNNLNAEAGLYRNESPAGRVSVRLQGAPANTRGVGARVRLIGGAVQDQAQEMMSGGRYLSADDAVRVFATGRITNGMQLEVRWRNGRRSVVTGVEANHEYVVDEVEAPAMPADDQVAGKPAKQPVFKDVSSLLGHRHHEAEFDDFERQPLLPRRLSRMGPGVAWCDLNGDGWDDLVIGAGRGGKLAVYGNNGQGGFGTVGAKAWSAPIQDDLAGVVGWVNEPGSSTLLAALGNYESHDTNVGGVLRYEVFFGEVRASQAVVGSDVSLGPLAVVDVDADGDLDLFVGGRVTPGRYPEPASSGVYRRVESEYTPDEHNNALLRRVGMVSGAIWTDLTGDGYAELVLACEWGPIRIYRNQQGKLEPWDAELEWGEASGTAGGSAQPGASALPGARAEAKPPASSHGGPTRLRLSELAGWWTAVTAGDFDGDGRLDLVAGNWGRNNKYAEYAGDRLRVWHGDVDENGVWDVIEGYYEPRMKQVVPWRDWNTVRGAIPIVGERFGSYAEYGRASVQEIYGDLLKRTVELQATALESVVLLNRGNRFELRPLPEQAQWSPVFGLCVGDYNGDGREDLFLGQNFFGTDRDTGRHDAGRGLWLQGDGRGGFQSVGAPETGVTVYGEQRGAALGDYDGDGRVDLVVTQNGAETKLYKNVGGAAGLRVRLAAAGGNGNGIGAVVRVGPADHWGPAREVHGGSGYWSQDSAVLVMGTPEPPTRIQVRWPGGKETVSPIPNAALEVQVTADGRAEKLR